MVLPLSHSCSKKEFHQRLPRSDCCHLTAASLCMSWSADRTFIGIIGSADHTLESYARACPPNGLTIPPSAEKAPSTTFKVDMFSRFQGGRRPVTTLWLCPVLTQIHSMRDVYPSVMAAGTNNRDGRVPLQVWIGHLASNFLFEPLNVKS